MRGLALASLLASATAGLPKDVVMAYASWGECDEQMVRAAENGANVLAWFAISLVGGNDGLPRVKGGPNLDCVSNKSRALEAMGLEVTHLISIGGWDQPHVNTSWTGREWFEVLDAWNADTEGRRVFDGFDWDLEGNDWPESPANVFTRECLRAMGEMSAAGKERGYLVTMAPPQSYLDPSTSDFSRNLTFPPVAEWEQDFFYHGRNVYCYLLVAFPGVFDLVSVQLYESYAAASYAVTQQGQRADDYLAELAVRMFKGWAVRFDDDDDGTIAALGPRTCAVAPEQLMFGLIANPNNMPKALFVDPSDVGGAWSILRGRNLPTPRGAMFWNAENDGKLVPANGSEPVQMARGLSEAIVGPTALE